MVQYPLHFHVESQATAGTSQVWTSSGSGLSEVTCAIPPEFQGPGGGYSPEDFFAMALARLHVTLRKPQSEDKARRILERVSQSCLVLNSVKTEKSFEFSIES